MSMSVYFGQNASVIPVIGSFAGRYDRGYYGHDLPYQLVNLDMMAGLIGDESYWTLTSDLLPINVCFGLTVPHSIVDSYMLSNPVEMGGHVPGTHYDDVIYGSFYQGLQIFVSAFTGKSFVAPAYDNERACRHRTYSGGLIAKQLAFPPSVIEEESRYFTQVSTHVLNDYNWKYGRVVSLDPFQLERMWYPYQRCHSLIDYLDAFRDKTLVYHGWWNSAYWDSYLTNVRYVKSLTDLVVTYDQHTTSTYPYWQEYRWSGRVRIPTRVSPPTTEPVLFQCYFASNGEPLEHSFNCSYATPWNTGGYTGEFAPLGENDLRYVAYPLAWPQDTVTAEREICSQIWVHLRDQKPLEKFRAAVDADWPNIVPSSLFSTVDAFQAAESNLGVDNLQTLVKLPGLIHGIPLISEGIRVGSKLLHRDLSLATLRELMDLLSNATLTASFEFRPYVDILTRQLPALGATLRDFGDIRSRAVGYGSFSFKISNDLGRDEVTLKTRTKLVMDASPSGLLSAILGVDALGLLPKPSRLWDLLPYSFLANWLTGVGKFMERAEYSLFLATIPAYFVHTYTLTSPLEGHELDSWQMSSYGPETASLRLYYRDVSTYNPIPRDSRFGFGVPTNLPPLGVLGSLLWQLIFS